MIETKRDELRSPTREAALVRLDMEDFGQAVVLVEQSGWSGGCETCEFWIDDMWIEVEGVIEYQFYAGYNTVGGFMKFLSGDQEQGYITKRTEEY